MKNKTLSREIGADFIRILAIIGVVYIHSDSITSSLTNYVGGSSWWLAAFFQSYFRIAVPLFVMLSGYLWLELKNKTPNFRSIFQKARARIGVPLLVWSGIYFWWQGFWWQNPLSFKTALTHFFQGQNQHLYFLFIIFGLYLLIPFIKSGWKNLSFSRKTIEATLWMLVGIMWLAENYFSPATVRLNSFTCFVPYIGYFLFGSVLSRTKPSWQEIWLVLIVILGVNLLTTFYYHQHVLNFQSGNLLFWNEVAGYYWWEHFSPNIILMSGLTFWSLINIGQLVKIKNKKVKAAISSLAVSSYGIYLIHSLVLDTIERQFNYAVHLITGNLWTYLMKKTFIVFALSYLVITVIRKIPYLKRIIGEK